MQIYAELNPKKDLEKIKEAANRLWEYDGFDLPHSPLGLPSMPPEVMACSLRDAGYTKRIIVNQRVIDYNELHLRSLLVAAKALQFDLAITMGDKPKYGEGVNQLTSQGALKIVKNLEPSIGVGLFISMRKSREEISERLRSEADFFLTMRVSRASDLIGFRVEKMIPYVLIRTEKNAGILESIGQPSITLDGLRDSIDDLRSIGVNAIIISAPGDEDSLTAALKYL